MKKKTNTMMLKQTVTIKAIVTEDFKKYLIHEFQNSIDAIRQKTLQVEMQGKKLIESLRKKGALDQISSIKQQMELERQQQEDAELKLLKKIEEANKLSLNSEFVQGTVDGFVTVEEGDNLYEKLGGKEIVIKDGIIQKIYN